MYKRQLSICSGETSISSVEKELLYNFFVSIKKLHSLQHECDCEVQGCISLVVLCVDIGAKAEQKFYVVKLHLKDSEVEWGRPVSIKTVSIHTVLLHEYKN